MIIKMYCSTNQWPKFKRISKKKLASDSKSLSQPNIRCPSPCCCRGTQENRVKLMNTKTGVSKEEEKTKENRETKEYRRKTERNRRKTGGIRYPVCDGGHNMEVSGSQTCISKLYPSCQEPP